MTTVQPIQAARDIMTKEPECIDRSSSLAVAARLFDEYEISGLPVVDQQGRLVGVVSKTDLIHRCLEGLDDVPSSSIFEILRDQGEEPVEIAHDLGITVDDVMTSDPATVTPEASIAEIATILSDLKIHRVIVVDDDDFPIGIVTSLDVLRTWPSA